MMDDAEEPQAGSDRDADLLLYDYFKHLTSLSLFSLGGVLALADKLRGSDGFLMVLGVLVAVSVGAICSFSGASEIVRIRYQSRLKQSRRSIEFYRIVAPALLSLGVGGFIYLFAKTMLAQ